MVIQCEQKLLKDGKMYTIMDLDIQDARIAVTKQNGIIQQSAECKVI